MTTTKQYDFLTRLQHISSVSTATNQVPVLYAYQYNDANQRTRATLADGSSWIYGYDPLGQVISGKKYWNDGIAVAGPGRTDLTKYPLRALTATIMTQQKRALFHR